MLLSGMPAVLGFRGVNQQVASELPQSPLPAQGLQEARQLCQGQKGAEGSTPLEDETGDRPHFPLMSCVTSDRSLVSGTFCYSPAEGRVVSIY